MASKKLITTELSVDEMLLELPKHERIVMDKLRSLILECLPRATEKISYGVPFYTHHRMICFIWPPSAYGAPKLKNVQNEHRIGFGFCQGNLMSNEDGALLAEGRKQVYCMYFTSPGEINEEQIRALLYEAELIDESFQKKKTKKKKF